MIVEGVLSILSLALLATCAMVVVPFVFWLAHVME